MGTIEQLHDKVDGLLEQMFDLSEAVKSATGIKKIVSSGLTESTVSEEEIAEISEKITSDLDAEGQPWDERIHASTKKQTVKNVWKLKKGVDKELAAQIKADNGVTAQPVITPVIAPPLVKTPVVATPEVEVEDPNKQFKQAAIKEINTLVSDFKVDYQGIIDKLADFDGAKDFDSLKSEHYRAVHLRFKTYREWLTMCQEEITKIEGFSNGAGQDGVGQILGQCGGSTLGEVAESNLSAMYDALKGFREAWEAQAAQA